MKKLRLELVTKEELEKKYGSFKNYKKLFYIYMSKEEVRSNV